MNKPIVWTIAGSDSSAGAGIQADLLTMNDFSVSACTVISAVTAQNSFAVGHVQPVSKQSIAAQINALDSDTPAKVIKLGMLACGDVVETVANYLEDFQGKGMVVCDPVLKASAGGDLLEESCLDIYRQKILAKVDVLTPNIPEAEILLGKTIHSAEELQQAAAELQAMGAKQVIIKGGHRQWVEGYCADYCLLDEHAFWMISPHQETVHSHGTGCTFASALAASLAKDLTAQDAAVLAKAYINQGLRLAQPVGAGPGAVAHAGFPEKLEDYPEVVDSLHDFDQQRLFNRCGKDLGLYPVVDSVQWLEKLLERGVRTIQLRIKNVESEASLVEQIKAAIELQNKYQARLFINDYWQLAVDHGAYGVHLGQEDLSDANLEVIARSGLHLGLSTHSWWEIARAHAVKPSYIAIGPIYSTTTKEMKFNPQGVRQLKQWVSLLSDYPTVAIGGINKGRINEVLSTGVDSVAVVSAITAAEDYHQAVEELQSAMHARIGHV